MKNLKILWVYNNLNLLRDLEGVDFHFEISMNKKSMEPVVESLEEARKPKDKWLEFDKKRLEINEKHANKDDKGKAVLLDLDNGLSQYDIPRSKQKVFDKEIEDLRKEYKEVIEARTKQIEDYQKKLEEENKTFRPSLFSKDIIPKNIKGDQMDVILDFIKEYNQ